MNRQEKGFGLITLAVTIAIASMVAAGAAITVVQIFKGTEQNEDRAEVTRQMQNLGRWFSRDALMAEQITAGDNPETGNDELCTIYWKDWESGDIYDIRYIWLDDADSLRKVMRTQLKDGDTTENITTLIAANIYSANLSQQGNTWNLNVETRSGQKSLVQEYRTTKRIN